jgi:hypothetical protein
MGDARIDLKRTRASLFYLTAYLFPLATGLLISPTATFHLLGSKAEHATTAWRLFGGLLLVLAILVVRLIRKHLSAAYINTAIGRMVFVGLFSYLSGGCFLVFNCPARFFLARESDVHVSKSPLGSFVPPPGLIRDV